MNRFLSFFILNFIVLQILIAGERVIYAFYYERPQRMEIFAFDQITKVTTRIFSDQGTPIELLPREGSGNYPGLVTVTANGRLFAQGIERSRYVGSTSPNTTLYELSTDGSNHYRKICELVGGHSLSRLLVNSCATILVYWNFSNEGQFLFVHNVESGKLIKRINVTNIFPDYGVRNLDWYPGTDSLVFCITGGPEGDGDPDQFGTHILDIKSGKSNKLEGTLSDQLTPISLKQRVLSSNYVGDARSYRQVFLCVQNDTVEHRITPTKYFFLTKSNSIVGLPTKIANPEGIGWFVVSPSGRFVAHLRGDQWTDDANVCITDFSTVTQSDHVIFHKGNCSYCGFDLIGWIIE
jgi:hypothetical protein